MTCGRERPFTPSEAAYTRRQVPVVLRRNVRRFVSVLRVNGQEETNPLWTTGPCLPNSAGPLFT